MNELRHALRRGEAISQIDYPTYATTEKSFRTMICGLRKEMVIVRERIDGVSVYWVPEKSPGATLAHRG